MARLNYSTDLFERGTIERMLGHLARVLEQVAADADVRLSRLELLGEAERALVLEEWNRTEAEYPADRCIHELFEAQAARTPDAVAVVFERGVAHLRGAERAGQPARPPPRAAAAWAPRCGWAICLERSLEMVVSLLAVLKAGRRVRAAGPRPTPPSGWRTCWPTPASPLLLTRGAPARRRAGARGPAGAWPWTPLAERSRRSRAENPAERRGAGHAGVRHLHLRLHRHAQGGDGAHRGRGEPAWLVACRDVRRRARATGCCRRPPLSFDVSVWEFCVAAAGGRAAGAGRARRRPRPALPARAIVREQRDHRCCSQAPPLLPAAARTSRSCGRAARCALLFCGGEALPAELAAAGR